MWRYGSDVGRHDDRRPPLRGHRFDSDSRMSEEGSALTAVIEKCVKRPPPAPDAQAVLGDGVPGCALTASMNHARSVTAADCAGVGGTTCAARRFVVADVGWEIFSARTQAPMPPRPSFLGPRRHPPEGWRAETP